jgi:N-(5'phosphoribosyl)anthranilate (PRA) isomerase
MGDTMRTHNGFHSRPEFITFTGVDDETDPSELVQLADDYPVEFGLLFSPKHQGIRARYPSLATISWLTEELPLRWAAHLCGADARAWLHDDHCNHDLRAFQRVQINTADPLVQPSVVGKQAARRNLRAILQSRSRFPQVESVDVLFDASGGRGVSPADWPQAVNATFCGYAGGLNPENVAQAVQIIGTRAARYWLDMESGVRDAHDRFSVAKCRAVCEAVYGKGPKA